MDLYGNSTSNCGSGTDINKTHLCHVHTLAQVCVISWGRMYFTLNFQYNFPLYGQMFLVWECCLFCTQESEIIASA